MAWSHWQSDVNCGYSSNKDFQNQRKSKTKTEADPEIRDYAAMDNDIVGGLYTLFFYKKPIYKKVSLKKSRK